MAEAVKVIVRCRPLNQREKDLKCKVIVEMNNEFGECCLTNPEDPSAPAKSFTFDGAYYMDSTTEQIYNEIVFPLVESVTEGYNGTVFAYGQTGCGKSFSMQGVPKPPTQRGVIPRAFEHIFEAISAASNTKFLVHASYLEIYNEDIRDLLGSDTKKKLELKESSDSGVYVAGLSMHPVHNVTECEAIMDKGWKSRAVGATLMNADSSRSHSIFTVYLERMTSNESDDGNIRKGKLNLVDLAGSERQAKTGATGDRLKEATKINLSLSALGNVISALVDGKSKHIPYRDSKLTRLLQDSLGGNTKTLMIACLSPADNNYDETLSTLRYANRAKNIKNKPRVNEDPKDALLREYQEEIRRLKALITDQGQPSPPPALSPTTAAGGPNASSSSASLGGVNDITGLTAEETEKIRQEYDQKLKELLAKFEQEQESNQKLKNEMNALKASYTNEKGQPPPTAMVHASEAIERLAALEDYMVGGEKANDPEINEKRAKRKRIAEKKINAISEALKNFDNDDQLLLKAYGDITEELRARTLLLKKAKKKIISLEREVSDLQSEFEQDRTDYLETIRRLEQQVKLYTQILDKVQPCIRRDCNYSNLDRIKADCVWDEDLQKWRLPDLIVTRTKLPPTSAASGINGSNGTRNYTSDLGSTVEHGESDGTTGSPGNGVTDGNNGENDSITDSHSQSSSPSDPSSIGDKLLQKLQRGMNETLAANYFKSKRRDALLNKNGSSPAIGHTTVNGTNGGVTGGGSIVNGHGNINNSTANSNSNTISNNLINNNNYLSKDNNKVSKGFHGRANGNITLTHNIANGTDGAKLTNANHSTTTTTNTMTTNVTNQLINGSLNGNIRPAPVSPVSRRTSDAIVLSNSTSPNFNSRKGTFISPSALDQFTNRSTVSNSLSALKRMPENSPSATTMTTSSAIGAGHLSRLNLAVTGGQATVDGITHNLNQQNNLSLKPIDGMSGLNGSFISSSASPRGDSTMSNKNKLFTLRNGHSGHSTSGTNGNSGNNKMVKSLEPEPTKNTGFTNGIVSAFSH